MKIICKMYPWQKMIQDESKYEVGSASSSQVFDIETKAKHWPLWQPWLFSQRRQDQTNILRQSVRLPYKERFSRLRIEFLSKMVLNRSGVQSFLSYCILSLSLGLQQLTEDLSLDRIISILAHSFDVIIELSEFLDCMLNKTVVIYHTNLISWLILS